MNSRDLSLSRRADREPARGEPRIAALLRTSCALAAELDFDRLVKILTDEATALCRAQFGAFFCNVKADGSEAYALHTVSGVDRSAFAGFPMPTKTAIFAPTFDGQHVVRFDDVTQAPGYGRNPPHKGMPAGHLAVRSYLAIPVVARDGEVIGGLFFGHSQAGVFHTEDEELLTALAAQAAVAIERERAGEARERFRRLFLSMLGHDLRNPLGAIAISTQMLQRLPDMPEQSRAGLQRIRRGTERMTRMVQQLLDFARLRSLDSSGIPVERQSGDLDSICREVVEELRTSYPDRRIEEEYEDHCSGRWDRDRMAQAFSNLVENALNHGKPDTPVHVRLWRRNGIVCGEVHNQGEIIPPAAIEDLFDPFRRVQAARTAKTQGLGLGLFITHQIVLAHGGTLFVVSSEDSGTTFRLSLPAESE